MILKSELSLAITKSKGNTFTPADFLIALQKLGIKEGDTICIHSELYNFGTPLLPKQEFLRILVKIFQAVVGLDGTVIMPTFTYSFCNNEDYDINLSPSTVGVLTEYFRTCPDVARTNHPIFSFAIWGNRKDEFLNCGWDAFSLDSVYGIMLNSNDSLIFFGAPKGYTFYYLSEQSVQVSHRHVKTFSGHIINNEQKKYVEVPYYVRRLDKRSIEDESKVNMYLNEQSMQTCEYVSNAPIYAIKCQDMFELVNEKLRKDEQFFLQ